MADETVNCLLLVFVLNIIVPVNLLDSENCDISINTRILLVLMLMSQVFLLA